MGLDDEQEKLRQAEEWVTSAAASGEQLRAAEDFIRHTLFCTHRSDLRRTAFYLLKKVNERAESTSAD
jgi:hypothetical protein